MRNAARPLRSFFRARSGNLALITAAAAPVLIGCAALTLDFLGAWSSKESLQSAADGAALAAAAELPLRSTTRSTVQAIVNDYVHTNVGTRFEVSAIDSDILDNRSGVHVALTAHMPSMFGAFFNADGYSPHAEAVARLAGGAPLCLLALEERQPNAILAQRQAHISAPNCAVLSNSTHQQGIVAQDSARITATMICSAGGAVGDGNYEPAPITDCPAMRDPLAGREEPQAGGCDHLVALSVIGNRTLNPGVYCGGLTILPGASATLSPGIYVMKNGPLQVSNNAHLIGNHVGFYFVGDLSTMNLAAGSEVDLTAPRDGPMAGFLFFANRVLLTGDLNLRHFRISSNNARNLLGTIYLRDGVLDVDADRPIADRSAYTVIVARRIQVTAGPDLVLNTDYEGTDVPVPDGVGPQRPHAYLAQ
ncbi:MAG TPA: pilus assembly protein TadG-related protein [Caulobacterales bacterium]|nr:pilus assembly protein TadG-related protein [Caulobacterales bacterium]